MYLAYKNGVVPFLAIFALRDIWVHVCTINCSNMSSYVKTSINETFSFRATLIILYINIDNSYIKLGGYFNNLRSRSENNIVEDMCRLNDLFNNIKMLKSSMIYKICKILRYSLDGRSPRLIILFKSMASTFLIYLLIVLRSEVFTTLLVVITIPL